MSEEIFQIRFTLNELNVVLGYLGKQPYENVYALIDNIQKQAQSQALKKMESETNNV